MIGFSAMNGWLWLAAALLLAAVELLLPGWLFMGLAGAAGVMAVLLLSGLWTAGLPLTLLAAAALAAVIWLVLHRIAGPRRPQDRDR